MLDFLKSASTPPNDLLGIIRYVRARWRARLAVKGSVRLIAVNVGVFFALAYLMQWSRFTPASILFSRLVLAAAIVGSLYFFIVRPLRRRVSDDQVALYLEEKEPSLQTMLISAVESSREGTALGIERVGREARRAGRREVLRGRHRSSCGARSAARQRCHLRQRRDCRGSGGAARSGLLPSRALGGARRFASVEAAAPYKIAVTPGNVSVPKGADQTINAKLSGFSAQNAVVMLRRDPTSQTYEKLPLVLNDKGVFEGIIFGVKTATEYFIDADGVKSSTYTLKVVDVPYVDKLALEYKFPAYTGLEPEKIEDGGDIATLRGTDVKVTITPTMKTKGGRLSLNDKVTVPLTVEADGTLTASFKADQDGSYHVELDAPNGEARHCLSAVHD
jgi:hypothetical protein